MIRPSLPAVCGLKYGVSGGSLYPSTSGSFLVSAEELGDTHADGRSNTITGSSNPSDFKKAIASLFAGLWASGLRFARRSRRREHEDSAPSIPLVVAPLPCGADHAAHDVTSPGCILDLTAASPR